MPIYEYECSTCGARFEKMMRIGAEAPPCPECASADVAKRISASGFILKGGGWYKDHYGLKSSSTSEGGESKAKSESKSETKSESSSTSSEKSAPAAAAK